MPDPDMVFTLDEVEQYERASGQRPRHHGRHHGPDMVFTPSEVASIEAAQAAPAAMTVEERDRYRRTHGAAPAGLPQEQRDAQGSATASRTSEGVNALGAANDTASAANAFRSTGEILPAGYRGPFVPRAAAPGPAGSPDLRPPGVRTASPMSDRVLGPLGIIAGLGQMYNAVTSGTRQGATDEDRTQALYGLGVGTTGAIGGVLTTAGNSTGAGVVGVAGGAIETAQGVHNLRSGDVNLQGAGGQQVMHGLLSGGASAATLAGATTTAAPVLAAGAAGVSVGTMLQQRADAVSLEQGRYTEQRAGRGMNGGTTTHAISASDRAAQQGLEDGQLTRDAILELTGNRTIAEGAGMFAGGVNTIGHAFVNTFSNLW